MATQGLGGVRGVLALVRGDESRAVVVRATTGLGKTTFLDRLAGASPWPVRRVRVNAGEAGWAHSGLLAFLSALNHPGLRGFSRQLTGPAQPDRFRLGAAVHQLLVELDLPDVLVLVDDVDLMDDASRDILGFVLRRLTETRLRVVATGEPTSRLAPFDGLATLVLEPLGDDAIARLLAERDPALGPAVAGIVAAAAGGRPGLAIDLLDRLPEAQRTGTAPILAPLPVPKRYAAAARRRFEALDLAGQQVVRLAALAPVTSVDVLAAACPPSVGDAGDVHQVVTDLLSREVLAAERSGVRIADPVLRSVVYRETPGDVRLRLHGLLGEAAGAGRPEAAWHRHHAHRSPELRAQFAAAAVAVAATGDVRAAVEYAEHLLHAGDPGPEAAGPSPSGTLLDLAYGFFRIAHFDLARRYADLSRAYSTDPGDALRRAHVLVGVAFHDRSRLLREVAVDAIEAHAAALPEEAVQLLLVLTFFHVERWDPAAARRTLARATAVAQAAGGAVGRTIPVYRELLEAFESNRPASSRLPDGVELTQIIGLAWARALTYGERYSDAAHVLDLVESRHHDGERLWSQTARLLAVDNDWRGSAHGRALAAVGELARDRGRPHAHRVRRLALESWYRRERGEDDAALAALDEVRAATAGLDDAGAIVPPTVADAEFALHTGDVGRALDLFARVAALADAVENPQVARHRPGLVEALARSGQHAAAADALASFERACARFPSRWARLPLARTRALLDDDRTAAARLADVLRVVPAADEAFEYARTLTAHARALAASGDDAAATRAARDAAGHFRGLGLPRWAAAVDPDPAGRPPAPPATDDEVAGLPPDERHLLMLVQDGRTNRQLAAALHVSVRTVEARLTTLYRRLGVASRAELLTRLPPPTTPTPPTPR